MHNLSMKGWALLMWVRVDLVSILTLEPTDFMTLNESWSLSACSHLLNVGMG